MELMVVVAIAGVLLALLLPAVSKAKRRAHLVTCINNSRQIGLCVLEYALDHSGSFPTNYDGADQLGGYSSWVAGFMTQRTEAQDGQLLINKQRSLLATYLEDPRLYKCPSDKSGYVRSYSMNNRMQPFRQDAPPGWLGGNGTNFAIYRNTVNVSRASEIFLVIEESSDSINDGYFAVDLSGTGDYRGYGTDTGNFIVDMPATYHNMRGGVTFVDGHVEAKLWHEPIRVRQAAGSVGTRTDGWRGDADWLRDHSAEQIQP
jgi:Tfp pilus assembly major pilin PilA